MIGGLLILFAAVGGSGAVVGMFAWLWHRVRVLEAAVAGGGGAAAGQLRAGWALPDEELANWQNELGMLHERVEFLERTLVTRGDMP
jgi:hypothetical protein